MLSPQSLHAINHYWYRTRYISRSVIGCIVLKFIGSSLVSLSLGKQPSWVDNPSYIISFLFAFCLVRSDSLEARELTGHMRYSVPATVGLNLLSALYKMRSLSHLVDEADALQGPLPTCATRPGIEPAHTSEPYRPLACQCTPAQPILPR